MEAESFRNVIHSEVFNFWEAPKQSCGELSHTQLHLMMCSLDHTDWFPRNLAYTGLSSTLSACLLTLEKDEVILELRQASALLRKLGLKSGVS